MSCDASVPHCETPDREAAARAIFRAQQNDATSDRAWSRWLANDERTAYSAPEPVAREVAPFDAIGWGYVEAAGLLDADYVSEQREVSAEDRAFAFSAEGEFLAAAKESTGDSMPDDELRKRSRESAELLTQSVKIAEKMREAGFEAIRDTPWELFRYFVHSRQRESLPMFRRCCFIPYVAQMIRAPQVAALEYFLERNLHCRFWTFSSGIRVELSGVRDRARWLHQKLKELNAQPFMRRAGLRFVFRSTELGTPETDAQGNVRDGGEIERDESGQLYFHVHAHVVVEMTKGPLARAAWSKVVAQVGAFWPAWWGEGGAIRNARECCKYVTKPGEMLKLSGAELVALQEQLSRLKLVQPLGSLAAEIAEREETGRRLVKRKTPDGRVYTVARNWNRHARRTRLEKAADAAGKLTPADSRGACVVVSRGMPRIGKCGVSEPVVTVMCKRGSWSEDTVRGHKLVSPLILATADKFAAGLAKPAVIRVHTRTPTVFAGRPERPEKPRGKPRVAALWPSEVLKS